MISMTPALTASVFSLALLGTAAVWAQEAGEQRTQSYRFAVTADDTHDLGDWSIATGLDVSWDIAEYRSGGAANVSRRYFPGIPKYRTITLSRSSSSEADLVIVWLQHLASTFSSATLVITLLDSDR